MGTATSTHTRHPSCQLFTRERLNWYRGTGWALGRTPPGHAPAQYNSAAPYYANYQPQYNNSNNPPPPPSYGQSQSYYGQNADYYGRQNDVELQQPENAYKPPEGPPPTRR